jgi:hypothetical protein
MGTLAGALVGGPVGLVAGGVVGLYDGAVNCVELGPQKAPAIAMSIIADIQRDNPALRGSAQMPGGAAPVAF